MRYIIFKHIKRWLIEYGHRQLDLILNPISDDKDPRKRYENFMDELNKHFFTTEFASENFYQHLPALTLNISDLGSSGCFKQYMLSFQLSFTTISPDTEKYINNTPEELYRVSDEFDKAFEEMFKSRVRYENQEFTRQLFTESSQLLPNEVLKATVAEFYPLVTLNLKDEIITLNKDIIIEIGECYGQN